MDKIKLDLDQLQVDSFVATAWRLDARGTVYAHETCVNTDMGCAGGGTEPDPCFTCAGGECETFEQGPNTEGCFPSYPSDGGIGSETNDPAVCTGCEVCTGGQTQESC